MYNKPLNKKFFLIGFWPCGVIDMTHKKMTGTGYRPVIILDVKIYLS
jgi:hypothetical protein